MPGQGADTPAVRCTQIPETATDRCRPTSSDARLERDLGRRIDALIVAAAPNVQKAVKWNSPFYGMEGEGWFLNFHCFTKYVKVAFSRGVAGSDPARRVEEW